MKIIVIAILSASCASQPHDVCMPGAPDGSPLQCPWDDKRVLGPVMPPPDAYPTCGYVIWSGPGKDFVVKPRPDEDEDYPCWTSPDRAVRRTFSSKQWREQHQQKATP